VYLTSKADPTKKADHTRSNYESNKYYLLAILLQKTPLDVSFKTKNRVIGN